MPSYKIAYPTFASTHNMLLVAAAHPNQLAIYLPSIDQIVAQDVSNGNHSRLTGQHWDVSPTCAWDHVCAGKALIFRV